MRCVSIAAITLGVALLGCAPASPVAPTATVSPTIGPAGGETTAPAEGSPIGAAAYCRPSAVAARVLSWDAGAGHRTAHVELRNTSATACTIHAMAIPDLVAIAIPENIGATSIPSNIGANGTVLINGTVPPASDLMSLASGAIVKTQVQDDNYCRQVPIESAITVAFLFPIEALYIVAAPVTPIDSTGLPPCSGNPGSLGSIEMQPWAP